MERGDPTGQRRDVTCSQGLSVVMQLVDGAGQLAYAIAHHLQEGLIAYASEMVEREEHWQVLWATAWAGNCECAQLVLSKHLNSSDDGEEVWISLLRVQIDVEDEEEFVDDLSEAE